MQQDTTQIWNRRRFFRWIAFGGMTSVLGWRFLIPPSGETYRDLEHLSEGEARILARIYSTFTGVDSPNDLVTAIGAMDRFLGELAPVDRLELRAALQLVEHSPLVFHGFVTRFTELSLEDRIRCLEGWRSGAKWRRPVFAGLKELSYLVFYTRPEHWEKIGYSGPMVPPPGASPVVDPRYAGLLAP